jgi:hypothetical protein
MIKLLGRSSEEYGCKDAGTPGNGNMRTFLSTPLRPQRQVQDKGNGSRGLRVAPLFFTVAGGAACPLGIILQQKG